VYRDALEHPLVVGLAIGTRPDCLPDESLDLLTEIARTAYLSLEIGIQTIHNRSLRWMNRGHEYDLVPDVIERCRGRGFQIGAHIMLGLPGESSSDMLATAVAMAGLKLDLIKLHNLYVVRNTPLAEQYARGEVQLLGRDEYMSVLVDFVEQLPPTTIVERISGESPGSYFVAPTWCLDKPNILRALRAEFERRDSWQGKYYGEAGRLPETAVHDETTAPVRALRPRDVE
ncbi:MAG TPA: TIGR01212 family radical SAM protein, partial [Pirellulaceae bacterium]